MACPGDEIDRAEQDGTLGLLAIDQMILADRSPEVHARRLGRAKSGLGEDAARFWRALGMTDPPPGEVVFTDEDIEMLHLVDQILRLGLVDKDVALQMARVIGSSASRIAFA